MEVVEAKLEAVGFGFLIPIFFIVSGMRFTFGRGTSDATLKMDPSQRTVGIFAGPSKSLGVETAKSGSLSVIPGSVAVVK